ncbi:MAG: ParA family protein [Clostridiales bacterium]|nr:ParA family protein [Clostridiales bacterium]
MGKIVAVANQKGGVGKTTTAINLASELALLGRQVLLCDFDPQGNATSGLGVDKKTVARSVYTMLTGDCAPLEALCATPIEGLKLLPADNHLAGAAVELIAQPDRITRLRDRLLPLRHRFDFLLIDCPPSLELLTVNALTACDTILVPTQCEFYALEGLSQLTNSIRQIKKLYNPALDIEGVLLTMYDGRLNLTVEVAQEIKRFFGGLVYGTVIPRNVRLSEAPSHGLPVGLYDKFSRGAESYRALAGEFLARNQPGAGRRAT